MLQHEFSTILNDIEDVRQRIDSVYAAMMTNEANLRKKIDACYKGIWRLIKIMEEIANEKA